MRRGTDADAAVQVSILTLDTYVENVSYKWTFPGGTGLTKLDDEINSIAAGGISGMIFRSTKGTKPMLISGGLVASAAGVWAVSFLLQQQQRLGFILTGFSLAVKCSFNF